MNPPEGRRTLEERIPRGIAIATGVILSFFWIYWILADLFGIEALRQVVLYDGDEVPLVWFHLFYEKGPVEQLQWSFLAFGTLLSVGLLVWALRRKDRVLALFTGFLAPGLAIMYVEDRYNTRHRAADWAIANVPWDFTLRQIRTVVEMGIYAVMGAVMVAAFVLAWRGLIRTHRARTYLLVGYGAYFVASFASASRRVFGWYEGMGDFLIRVLPTRVPEAWDLGHVAVMEHWGSSLGYYFLDQPFEESFELIGASMIATFLAALVARARYGP